MSAPAILKELRRRFGGHIKAGGMPTSARTLSRRLRLYRRDPSGPWTLGSADPGDVAVVMPVLAAVIELTEGRRTQLTIDEARISVSILRAFPQLKPLEAYMAAREYLSASHPDDVIGLEAKLAFSTDLDRWFRAVESGWIPGRFARWLAAAVDEKKRDGEWKGTYSG